MATLLDMSRISVEPLVLSRQDVDDLVDAVRRETRARYEREAAEESARRRSLNMDAYYQEGFFSAQQAFQSGYSTELQQERVNAGEWTQEMPGVYRLSGWPSSITDHFIQWTLWSGNKGVISHGSAVEAHELSDIFPVHVSMTVPPGFQQAPPTKGITVPKLRLYMKELERETVCSRTGYRVTTPLRSIIDAAETEQDEFIEKAVWDALDRGIVTEKRLKENMSGISETAKARLERAINVAKTSSFTQIYGIY